MLAKIRRWASIMTSLALFAILQFIGSQTGIILLTKIERQKKWIIPLAVAGMVVLIGLWISILSRPFSTEFLGVQLLGITAVSSIVVVGYRAIPTTPFDETFRRAKWLIVLAAMHSLNAARSLTYPTNRKMVLKGIAAILLLSVTIWYRQPLLEASAIIQDQDAIVAYLNEFGSLAPILLSIALVLQVFVAAIPGHVLILGGGYVYGFWTILAICLITTVGASQLAFLLAKWAGRPLVERMAPRQLLDKWNGAAEENGMVFFMFAFMLPVFPADVLNYVAGLSSLSGRRFFVANFFGRLPGLVLLCVLGANGLALTAQLMMVITAVGLLMFVGWYYLFVYSKR